ncbi:MAG: type I-B CRISPR-associated protein Cas7/Cst2/DevR [Bacillota bacterium]
MAFVAGLLLIDAPASALNNLGQIPGARTDNTVGVKVIKARDGAYPYVSAQAFRYWLRMTLQGGDFGWKAAPIFREEKVAYADANPIKYWDDDLFGYMRAPSTKASAQKQREQDQSRVVETPTRDTVTRASPFRVSTLVSVAPVTITDDFGVMARHEGDPVPYEHQFYRTTLKGLFSLDLRASGTFWYRNKTGFRNLDDERMKIAEETGLEHLRDEKAYRLPFDRRVERVATLFEGLAHLEGGAKQTLHYTDVSPVVTVMAVTKGGNHIFGHVVGATARGFPELRIEALEQVLTVFADEILSPVYVGWVRGYMDEERVKLEAFADTPQGSPIRVMHPREAFAALVDDLRRPENGGWLD